MTSEREMSKSLRCEALRKGQRPECDSRAFLLSVGRSGADVAQDRLPIVFDGEVTD
jgi:hypothetical protein